MSQKKDPLHGQALKMSMKSQKRHQSGASSKRLFLKGEENKISLVQTYSKTFHCTYLLHDYPFDTQVCLMN